MVRPYKTKLDWVTGTTKISVVGVCQEDNLEKEIALEIKAFYLKEGGTDLKQPVWLKTKKELHYNLLHDSTSGKGKNGWHVFKADDSVAGTISYSQNPISPSGNTIFLTEFSRAEMVNQYKFTSLTKNDTLFRIDEAG